MKVLAKKPGFRRVAKRDPSRKADLNLLQRVYLSPEFPNQVLDLLALGQLGIELRGTP